MCVSKGCRESLWVECKSCHMHQFLEKCCMQGGDSVLVGDDGWRESLLWSSACN